MKKIIAAILIVALACSVLAQSLIITEEVKVVRDVKPMTLTEAQLDGLVEVLIYAGISSSERIGSANLQKFTVERTTSYTQVYVTNRIPEVTTITDIPAVYTNGVVVSEASVDGNTTYTTNEVQMLVTPAVTHLETNLVNRISSYFTNLPVYVVTIKLR